MTEREKMLRGEPYDASDPELVEGRVRARRLTQQLSALDPADHGGRVRLLGELLGAIGTDSWIEAPFHSDYGSHIRLGARVFVNMSCVFLDAAPIVLGDDVQLGPGVQLLTSDHPRDAGERAALLESALPISIGSRAWLGGGTIVLPGVEIGRDAIIGAGSVVTRSVPPGVTAAGNPCRVIKDAPDDLSCLGERARDYRDASPCRRIRVTDSIVTAVISTAPVTMNFAAEEYARRFMPLAIEPITTAPSSADQTEPRPPNRLVPAMTGPAMAISSKSLLPEDWLTAIRRDAASTPPAAASVDASTKTSRRTWSILMPARRAASALPPTANMCRPKRVLSVRYANASAKAKTMTMTRGSPRPWLTMKMSEMNAAAMRPTRMSRNWMGATVSPAALRRARPSKANASVRPTASSAIAQPASGGKNV